MSGRPRNPRPAGLVGQLGAKIEALRKRKGLNVHELADLAGVSAGFILNTERGERDPSILRVQAIANALGTTGKKLIGEW